MLQISSKWYGAVRFKKGPKSIMKICVIYLDGLIVYASTFEEHLERLDLILTRLSECGIKVSPDKMSFFGN